MYYITQNTFMNSKGDFYNMYTHSGNRKKGLKSRRMGLDWALLTVIDKTPNSLVFAVIK